MSVIQATEKDFFHEIKTGVVLVDFWAEWCTPCKMISPIIDEFAQNFEGKVKVLKINVERERDIVDKLGIMSIPTIYIYQDGELKEKTGGFVTLEQLSNLVQPYIESN